MLHFQISVLSTKQEVLYEYLHYKNFSVLTSKSQVLVIFSLSRSRSSSNFAFAFALAFVCCQERTTMTSLQFSDFKRFQNLFLDTYKHINKVGKCCTFNVDKALLDLVKTCCAGKTEIIMRV